MAATIGQVLKEAASQIGYTESPARSNRTKYGAWYGMDGQPWCAMFISWLFRDTLEAIGGKFAYTPTGANWFKRNLRWSTTPKVGAIVFFDFPDSVTRIQHVGIVEKVNADGSIVTIEGNTSSGSSGSQDNGGGVFRRTRKASIVGYGYPRYATGVPVPIPEEVDEDMPEHYIIAGGHTRSPEHPDFRTEDQAFIDEIKAVCAKYGKQAQRVAVPKMTYKDGKL